MGYQITTIEKFIADHCSEYLDILHESNHYRDALKYVRNTAIELGRADIVDILDDLLEVV